VARAIAGSKVPVISAVGHEVDFTIADFVADVRAATPSHAAELVVSEKRAVADAVLGLRQRLERAAARPLQHLKLRVDDLETRLLNGGHGVRGRAGHRVELLTARLRAASPFARLRGDRHRLERLMVSLETDMRRRLVQARHGVAAAAGRLDSLSPLGVLSRGYSLTRRPDGRVIRRASEVQPGESLHVLLREGSLDCRVDATREHDDRPQV
jgi:exodeoxyribonuclease VII large subunit